MPAVDSPCLKRCALDETRTHCVACLRTPDEIAGWQRYGDDERRAVWRRIAWRRTEAADGSGADGGEGGR